MAGGIGVTPLITMAHRLHALGKDFVLHYSARSEAKSGFAASPKAMAWADKVFFHFSADSGRVNFDELIPEYRSGFKLYTCGSDRYMDAVFETAEVKDWPEEGLSKEYFSVPEAPDYVNHDFVLELTRTGRSIAVAKEESATDALAAAGLPVSAKCPMACAVSAQPVICLATSSIGTTSCRKRNGRPKSYCVVRGPERPAARSASIFRLGCPTADQIAVGRSGF